MSGGGGRHSDDFMTSAVLCKLNVWLHGEETDVLRSNFYAVHLDLDALERYHLNVTKNYSTLTSRRA
jgi:hypothetical protein